MILANGTRALKKRIKDVLTEFEDDNPRTAGNAYRVIGGLLIADGLVGLENPFDGKKTRPGILGSVGGILVGFVLALVALFAIHIPDTDATTSGTISEITRSTSTDSDGTTSTVCGFRGTFEVDGSSYRVESNASSSGGCDRVVGDPVPVEYNSADPSENTTDKGELRLIKYGILGAGLLSMVASAITFLIRLASIVFGWRLYRRGGAILDEHPEGSSADEDVVGEARRAFFTLRDGASFSRVLGGS